MEQKKDFIKCDKCQTKFDVTTKDIYRGMGATKFTKCPVCGKEHHVWWRTEHIPYLKEED